LVGKRWLESKDKEPSEPPITENFPESLKTLRPIFIERSPVISNKNPTHEDNSLSVPKTLKKTPQIPINGISPRTPEKFLLNNPNKNSDQLKTSQPLPLTANKEQKPTKKEFILLQKIKHLEEQLKQTQELAKKEKQRANQAEQQLREISQQLEQGRKKIQAQIIQPPPLKVK